MKKVYKDKIVNIQKTDLFDNRFLFKYLILNFSPFVKGSPCNEMEGEGLKDNIEVVYLSELLEKRKNESILEKVKEKPAMWSMVYSPKDELEIFTELFEKAISTWKKIHIVWVTLDEEIKMLEDYYEKLWFFKEEINCFDPDFSKPLVTVSVKIENLMYRWSDYKRLRDKIFFNPPIRESGQVKAMFKWINRGVIAWIYFSPPANGELETGLSDNVKNFLEEQIKTEHILPIILAKVLCYNLEEIWFVWEKTDLVIQY